MERWNIPRYLALKRFLADNPTADMLARGYFKVKPRYTPPASDEPPPEVDWSVLDGPLPDMKGAQPIRI